MNVIEQTWPDGNVSYQVISATPDELADLSAAADANSWIQANAVVTMTAQVGQPAQKVVDS